ncbi:Uncharacterised protein [Mycobacteroides abscessus subsp. abscessus]|nr:Uncharacterised protein [Mycobacteroides abscessus subsp. abscessus]
MNLRIASMPFQKTAACKTHISRKPPHPSNDRPRKPYSPALP